MPKLTWADHRITISGLGLGAPTTLTMDELAALPQRSLPVTLVCAGNRRKEVNVTRQSKGFSWGSGAVSTSVWTGVPLHALLRHCSIDEAALAGRAIWVKLDGPDGELPKGTYGTSIPLLKVSPQHAYIPSETRRSRHSFTHAPTRLTCNRRWTPPRTCWWPSSRTTSRSSPTMASPSA